MRAGQDVCRLGHEVDAAEDHELGFVLVGGKTGQTRTSHPSLSANWMTSSRW